MAPTGPHCTRGLPWRPILLALVLLAVICLAAAWTWSPMRDWLDVDRVVAALQRFGHTYGLLTAVVGFALALTVAVPLTFLSLVALVAFGPLAGFACAMAGAQIGAAASYGLGRALGREVVQRLAGARVNMLSQRLARNGLIAVIVLRLVPVAPFAVVNMAAGASHIRLRDFLLGTAIGMTPSTLALMLFVDQISAALRHPTPLTFALLALTIALIAGGAWLMQRWLRKVDES